MDWFRPPTALTDQSALHVGDGVTIRLTGDQDSAHVIAPDGSVRALTGTGAERYFGATDAPGVYVVERLANGEIRDSFPFVVNAFDALESDITPRAELTLGSTVVGTAQPSEERGQHEFWSWLALAALLILLIEWIAYHRREHVRTVFSPLRRQTVRA
jgi:hypothetical protein